MSKFMDSLSNQLARMTFDECFENVQIQFIV